MILYVSGMEARQRQSRTDLEVVKLATVQCAIMKMVIFLTFNKMKNSKYQNNNCQQLHFEFNDEASTRVTDKSIRAASYKHSEHSDYT